MKYSNIFKQTKYTHIYTLHNIHFGDFFYQTYYNVKLLIIEHSLVAASATAAGAQGHFCILFSSRLYTNRHISKVVDFTTPNLIC